MSTTDLGFDPTFQLLNKQPGPERIPSYLIPNSIVAEGFDALPWVVTMPNKDGTGREEFVTVRAISTNRAGVVRGRGTRIWVVCLFEDYKTSASGTLVPVSLQLSSFLVILIPDIWS